MKSKILNAHYILIISVFLLLIGAWIFTRGMFFDGQQYATVALNLAKGKGSFWFPFVTDSWQGIRNHAFLEQFTLGYWIESRWFKVLPNSMYTEKIFCASICIINAYWIVKLCKEIKQQLAIDSILFEWLIVLIWLLIPIVFWSFSNNVLEILMSTFCTMAVYFQYKSIHNKKIAPVVISTICIVASLFSKGLPGIFVLGFYSISFLFGYLSFSKAALFTLIQIAILVLLFIVLFQFPDAKESITYYLQNRLLGRIQSSHNVTNRFTILSYLFNNSIIILIICSLSFFIKKSVTTPSLKKQVLFWFVCALSGVLPLMLTMVQKDFYILQIYPFLAIAAGIFCFPLFNSWYNFLLLNSKKVTVFTIICYLLLSTSIFCIAKNWNGYSRHQQILEDIDTIGKLPIQNKQVSLSTLIREDWFTYFYLMRFTGISGMPDTNSNFMIASPQEDFPGSYQPYLQCKTCKIGKK